MGIFCKIGNEGIYFETMEDAKNYGRYHEITYMNCSHTFIEVIQELPKKLQILNCMHNNIKKIENLPETLRIFNCCYNQIEKIENIRYHWNGVEMITEENKQLPESLQVFNCGWNQIKKIENLPKFLRVFSCCCNQLKKIENLPKSLLEFYCFGNTINITYIDKLPLMLYICFIDRYYELLGQQERQKIRENEKIKEKLEKIIDRTYMIAIGIELGGNESVFLIPPVDCVVKSMEWF